MLRSDAAFVPVVSPKVTVPAPRVPKLVAAESNVPALMVIPPVKLLLAESVTTPPPVLLTTKAVVPVLPPSEIVPLRVIPPEPVPAKVSTKGVVLPMLVIALVAERRLEELLVQLCEAPR